jgi:hypothetical protein
MKFTVGKLVWGISIIIFLVFAYGHSMFERILSIYDGTGSTETHVQSYVSESPEASEPAGEGPEVALEISESAGLSDILGGVGSSSVPENEIEDSDLYLQVELLKYRVQELEEDYEKVRIEMKEAHNEKDDSMDNILAIMTTLLPIALPKNHNKEITVFKKEVKK